MVDKVVTMIPFGYEGVGFLGHLGDWRAPTPGVTLSHPLTQKAQPSL